MNNIGFATYHNPAITKPKTLQRQVQLPVVLLVSNSRKMTRPENLYSTIPTLRLSARHSWSVNDLWKSSFILRFQTVPYSSSYTMYSLHQPAMQDLQARYNYTCALTVQLNNASNAGGPCICPSKPYHSYHIPFPVSFGPNANHQRHATRIKQAATSDPGTSCDT